MSEQLITAADTEKYHITLNGLTQLWAFVLEEIVEEQILFMILSATHEDNIVSVMAEALTD
jgi:hypothetical protein